MPRKFSEELDKWLRGDGTKTIAGLSQVFAKKSFAICFLILMAIPALPLPTGGVTHVFEVINMLLALPPAKSFSIQRGNIPGIAFPRQAIPVSRNPH